MEIVAEKQSYAYEWAASNGYFKTEVPTPDVYFTTETLSDGTLAITGYTGEDEDVVVPAQIGGVQVTKIGNSAFERTSITSVVIPEGVTIIGDSAFFVCESLQEVRLPSTLKEIGNYAFGYVRQTSWHLLSTRFSHRPLYPFLRMENLSSVASSAPNPSQFLLKSRRESPNST